MTSLTARRAVIVAAMVSAAFLSPEAAVAQCAMCRRALASPDAQHLVAALRAGILLLLPAPFASFATVAYFAVRKQRLRDRIERESEPDASFGGLQ